MVTLDADDDTDLLIDVCQVIVIQLLSASLQGWQTATVHLVIDFPTDRLRDLLRPLLMKDLFLTELCHVVVLQEQFKIILGKKHI